MKTDIKLCVFDIDGTLKSKNQEIKKSIIQTIEKLQEKNIYCTVATGRGYGTTVHDTNKIIFNAPLIILDGSCIVDYNKNNIYSSSLEDTEIRHVKKFADINMRNISFMGFWDPSHVKTYIYATKEYQQKLQEAYPHIKCIFLDTRTEFIEHAYKKFPSLIFIKTTEKIYPSKKVNAVYNDDTLNFVNRGISKKYAIDKLSKLLDVKDREIVVFGNDDNDIPMFNSPYGLKVAMKNSSDTLKQYANIITNDIEKILKEIL